MSIKNDIEELARLDNELKRIHAEAARIRKIKAQTEKRIADYLQQKELPGAKVNNTAVVLDNKTKTLYKTKKQKEASVVSVLRELGVQNPQSAYQRITEASRKDVVQSPKITFKKV